MGYQNFVLLKSLLKFTVSVVNNAFKLAALAYKTKLAKASLRVFFAFLSKQKSSFLSKLMDKQIANPIAFGFILIFKLFCIDKLLALRHFLVGSFSRCVWTFRKSLANAFCNHHSFLPPILWTLGTSQTPILSQLSGFPSQNLVYLRCAIFYPAHF